MIFFCLFLYVYNYAAVSIKVGCAVVIDLHNHMQGAFCLLCLGQVHLYAFSTRGGE